MRRAALNPLTAVLVALALGGCANPDAPHPALATTGDGAPGNPGEPPAPAPRTPASQRPIRVQPSAAAALDAFAELYVNWDYRTLQSRQRALAASSVGAARTGELQAAAASAGDRTLTAGRIANGGSVLSIAPERAGHGLWVVVTREHTSGASGYQGLPSSDHVTLARAVRLGGGYVVSEWLPQS